MSSEIPPKEPNIYLPGLPVLDSDDLDTHIPRLFKERRDLARQLVKEGMSVPNVLFRDSYLKNMLEHAQSSDAFIFPPMTSLPNTHKLFKNEAAQRWFEFFSVVTGVHVGNPEKYSGNIAKPCIVMDPDGQWKQAIDLLEYLKAKGMFNSRVEDIVQIAPNPDKPYDLEKMNADKKYRKAVNKDMNEKAVQTLVKTFETPHRKSLKDVPREHGDDHKESSFRKDIIIDGVTKDRHPFGVALFGSATNEVYAPEVEQLTKMVGERGWRLVTGAGKRGCMGAADRGFNEGKEIFRKTYPHEQYQPAHVGVSTQSILRLEGPPPYLDQLIITDDIYDRMAVMIGGYAPKTRPEMSPNEKEEALVKRLSNTVKVLFVAPGGTGTLHEFATMMQLATNGTMMKNRTVVLLDFQGFWKPLLETAKLLGFNDHFEVADSPKSAMEIADRCYKEWVDRHEEHENLPHPKLNPNPSQWAAKTAMSSTITHSRIPPSL